MWTQRPGCEGEVGADPWDSVGRRLTLAVKTQFEGTGGPIREEAQCSQGGVQNRGQLCGAALALLPHSPSPGLAPHLWGSESRASKARGGSQPTPMALSTEIPCFPAPGPPAPPAHSSQQEALGVASPGDPQHHCPDQSPASLGSCEPGLPRTPSGCLWASIHGSDRQRREALLLSAMAAAAPVSRSSYRDHLLKNQKSGDRLSPETADRQRPSQDRRPRPG